MKIVVLAGGLCSERNVSIVSGKQVYNALRKKGHNVVLLDVFMGYEESPCDIDELFENNYSFAGDITVDELVPDLKAVKDGNVWCTTPDFFQIADTIGSMINDINLMLNADSNTTELTYLKKLK